MMGHFNQEHPMDRYYRERKERIESYKSNDPLLKMTDAYIKTLSRIRYSANFSWLGRPIIQIPQDLMALQDIIWSVKPDVIIETGIAHGGSLIFYASMLELSGKGRVIGIDIDIRAHNRVEIEKHPMFKRITMIEGSSVSPEVIDRVRTLTMGAKAVLVCLDSNHTHDHVLRELELYAPLVTAGSYCVVFDTGIEDLPADAFLDRPWGPGNSPKTAVYAFLKTHDEFVVDKDIEARILLTAAPDGYLKKIR
jgi:cephalosporin hydroxylase